jgi:Tol biopolymer transport system component
VITDQAGHLDWGPNNLLAFDKPGSDGQYNLYTMQVDGSGLRCLTCESSELPKGNKGNPAWHPSGTYVVFQAAQSIPEALQSMGVRGGFGGGGFGRRRRMIQGDGADGSERNRAQLLQFYTRPGQGWLNDLWVTDADGRRFWRLTSVPVQGGTLHAQFSREGDRLFWAERLGKGRTSMGEWGLKVADFSIEGGTPRITNVRLVEPGKSQGLYFFESHGIFLHSRKLLFTANNPAGPESAFDVYTYDSII